MKTRPQRIAILGATSHIAKGLIADFAASGETELTLYARNRSSVDSFLESLRGIRARVSNDFDELPKTDQDVVVNCILSRETSEGYPVEIFETTEYFDNLLIRCLEWNPGALGISLSSGSVFGGEFSSPVTAETTARLDINGITPRQYYQAVKLYSEAKHRALSHLNIVDIRIYAYFSRFIDLSTRFLLTDMVRSVRDGTVFETDGTDIVRDYVRPNDLRRMIDACTHLKRVNAAFDLYSLAPVKKSELLQAFAAEFGLRSRFMEGQVDNMRTGTKIAYYSTNHSAGSIGYRPVHTALETVLLETRILLQQPGH